MCTVRKLIILILIVVASCVKDKIDYEAIFSYLPVEIEETILKKAGFKRIKGVDLDIYNISSDTAAVYYEYQYGKLQRIVWEQPYHGVNQFLSELDRNEIVLLSDEKKLKEATCLFKNNRTGDTYKGYIIPHESNGKNVWRLIYNVEKSGTTPQE